MAYGFVEEERQAWESRGFRCFGCFVEQVGYLIVIKFSSLLTKIFDSYSAGIPASLPAVLVPQVKTYIATSDISLLSQALIILAILLEVSPQTTFPEIEHDLLNEIYAVSHSPLVSGAALDSLFRFFASLVLADNQIATHLVPNLAISSEKAPKAENSPANVAKCIAQVVKYSQGVAAGTIAEYSKNLRVCLCLFPIPV